MYKLFGELCIYSYTANDQVQCVCQWPCLKHLNAAVLHQNPKNSSVLFAFPQFLSILAAFLRVRLALLNTVCQYRNKAKWEPCTKTLPCSVVSARPGTPCTHFAWQSCDLLFGLSAFRARWWEPSLTDLTRKCHFPSHLIPTPATADVTLEIQCDPKYPEFGEQTRLHFLLL